MTLRTATLLLWASTIALAQPRFVAGPAVTPGADGVTIAFAVDAATDVAVEVLDARGETVRHLAAGLLGENAPPPLQRDALGQSLVWDRTDDVGRPVPPGRYSVRVGLGLSPRLERLENFEPLNFGAVFGLAATAREGVCVFGTGGYSDHLPRLVTVDRRGAYGRQLFPPPAGVDPDRTPGLPGFRRGDGRWVPILAEAMPRPKDSPAHSPMAACGDRLFVIPFSGSAVRAVDTRTGALSGPLGGELLGQGKGKIAARALAASPDGRWIYLTGVETGGDPKDNRALHVVYRMPADGSQPPRAFVGDPEKAGAAGAMLDTPIGLAVDTAGRLMVCDSGNGRVAIFAADGSPVRTVAVGSPVLVQVDQAGAAIFVLTASAPVGAARTFPAAGARLVRIGPDGTTAAPQPLALPPKMGKPTVTGMALDASADPPVLWLSLSGTAWPMSAGGLLRYECRGDGLAALVPISTDYARFTQKGPYDPRLFYNWGVQDSNYIKYGEAFDWKLLTDAGRPFYSLGPLTPNGPWADGNRYAWNDWTWYHKKRTDVFFKRYAADGSPLPFAAGDDDGLRLDHELKAPWYAQRGTMVDRRGQVYARYSFACPQAETEGLGPRNAWVTGVLHYDADGRKVGEIHLTHGTYGMGVDARGNIYVGDKPRPAEAMVPLDVEKAFNGRVPASVGGWYGSVIKFGPKGGRFKFARGAPPPDPGAARPGGDLFRPPLPTLDADIGPWDNKHYTAMLEGAEWIRVGLSPMVTTRECICYGTNLAVDPHGRVFAPDKMACRVAVLDAAGNLVRHIGAYGNLDSRGPGSPVPDPPIAFALVRMVASVTSRQVRVADNGNGWVSVIALGLILTLVNAIVRPLAKLVGCLPIIVTFGLFTLVINAFLFWLTGYIGQAFGVGFTVGGFWPALLGGLVVSAVSIVMGWILRDDVKRKSK